MEKKLNDVNGNEKPTKERILEQAVKDFSRYGYHGTTTRTIANNVGINISALHYHWGDKQELYEAAVIYVNKIIARANKTISTAAQHLCPEEKLEYAVRTMSSTLFDNPECAALSLFDFLVDTRDDVHISESVKESTMRNYVNIAKEYYGNETPPKEAMLELTGAIQMMYHYVVAQDYFMHMLDIDKEEYIEMVNNAMKKIYKVMLPVK